MTKPSPQRFHSEAGIALGPILFILALLAIIGAVVAAGSGGFGVASIADRVSADTASQTNLILSKISECNLKYGTNQNGDGYPSSDPEDGTPVSQIGCAGDAAHGLLPNLWTGARPTTLPPPTQGFTPWTYINTNPDGQGGVAENGRCMWIQPTDPGRAAGDEGVVSGLTKAASKFTTSPNFSPTAQVIYDPSSPSQKFIVWITMPTNGEPSPKCLP